MSGQVVYIDDEELLCRSFAWILKSSGIAAKTFTDPHEALPFIRDHEIAIVLCDFRMPRMNALDLLQQIDKELPFYVVSGDLDISRFVEGQPRVRGVIPKPFAIEAMLATVTTHVSASRGSR